MAFRADNPFRISHPSVSGQIDEGTPAHVMAGGLGVQAMFPITRRVLTVFVMAEGGMAHLSFHVTLHGKSSVSRLVDPRGFIPFEVPYDFAQTAPCMSLGGGSNVRLGGRTSLLIEWRYHRLFTRQPKVAEDSLTSTSHYTARAGLALRLR
jgi:hypothetical protein